MSPQKFLLALENHMNFVPASSRYVENGGKLATKDIIYFTLIFVGTETFRGSWFCKNYVMRRCFGCTIKTLVPCVRSRFAWDSAETNLAKTAIELGKERMGKTMCSVMKKSAVQVGITEKTLFWLETVLQVVCNGKTVVKSCISGNIWFRVPNTFLFLGGRARLNTLIQINCFYHSVLKISVRMSNVQTKICRW